MSKTSIKLGQIARSVSNLPASETWYRDVLGLQHLFTVSNMAFFQCGEVRLMLTENSKEQISDSIIYFSVEDIQSEQGRLSRHGVDIIQSAQKVHQHEDGSEEWMAFFNDLEGRPLGLMSLSKPS